ncbi:MAG: hypothetical protein V1725_05360 [archaeon]
MDKRVVSDAQGSSASRYVRGFAQSVVLLLVALLACSSALAIMSLQSIHGGDGVEGFRARSDTITAVVNSQSVGVIMAGVQGSCTGGLVPETNIFQYTCTIADELPEGQQQATYQFSNSLESITASLFVDEQIPDATVSFSLEEGLQANVQATDPSPCSGLQSIQLVMDGSTIAESLVEGQSCMYSGILALNRSDLETGTHVVHVLVTDKLGNEFSSLEQNVSIDVSPPEISNLIITRANGQPIGSLAPGFPININIYFSIEEQDLARATADLSTINDIAHPQGIAQASCEQNETTYTCSILDRELRSDGDSVMIRIVAEDSAGNVGEANLTASFSLDTAQPGIQGLRTGYCDAQRCYVQNGVNDFIITLAGSGKTYDDLQIFYAVGDGRNQVQSCNQSTCYGRAAVQCQDGQSLNYYLVAGSRDDAGNEVQGDSAVVVCDTLAPVIQNVTFNSSDPFGMTITGSTVTITAYVKELNPLQATLNVSQLASDEVRQATCSSFENDVQACTWQVQILREGYFVADLTFIFSDIVNNTILYRKTMPVLGVLENDTPTFFSAQVYEREIKPQSINRITLQLITDQGLEYPTFIPYRVSSTEPTAVLVHTKMGGCIYQIDGQFADYDILTVSVQDEELGLNERNRLNAYIVYGAANALPDTLIAICNISVYGRKDNIYYEKPQILTLRFPLHFRESSIGTPGEQFVEKIKHAEASTWNHMKWLDTVDKWASTLQQICQVDAYLNYAQQVGVVLKVTGDGINKLAPPAGTAPSRSGAAVVGAVQKITENVMGYKMENAVPFVGQMCDAMSCKLFDQYSPVKNLDQSVIKEVEGYQTGGGLGGTLKFGDLAENLGTSDLHNSLVMSILRFCVPAVMYNLNKFRQENCEYIQCLKEYSYRGLDVSYCEELHSTKQCQFIIGEVYELPFVRIGKNLFTNFNELIRNIGPVSLWKVLDNSVCKNTAVSEANLIANAEHETKFYLCQLPRAIYEAVDFQKRSTINRNFYYSSLPNYCAIANCVGPQCHAQGNSLFGFELPNIGGIEAVVQRSEGSYANLYREVRKYTTSYGLPRNPETGAQDDSYRRQMNMAQQNLLGFIDAYNTDPQNKDEGRQITSPLNEEGKMTSTDSVPGDEDYKPGSLDVSFDSAKGTVGPPNQGIQRREQGTNPTTTDAWKEWNQQLGNDAIPPEGSLIRAGGKVWRMQNGNWVSAEDSALPTDRTYSAPGVLTTQVLYNYQQSLDEYLSTTGVRSHEEPDSVARRNNADRTDALADQLYNDMNQYYAAMGNPNWRGSMSEADMKAVLEQGGDAAKTYVNQYALGVKKQLEQRRRITRMQEVADAISILTKFALEQFHLDKFLSSEYWFDQWGFTAGTKFLGYTDPDEWKNSLCNPNANNINAGKEGAVYSCKDRCSLVLSYAGEKIPYNYTENNQPASSIYTIIVYLGPVLQDPDLPRQRPVNYRIELRGQRRVNIDVREWSSLPFGETASVSFSTVSSYAYDQLCIVFQEPFPPSDLYQEREYCRPIRENVLSTGSPVPEEQNYAGPDGGPGEQRNPDI